MLTRNQCLLAFAVPLPRNPAFSRSRTSGESAWRNRLNACYNVRVLQHRVGRRPWVPSLCSSLDIRLDCPPAEFRTLIAANLTEGGVCGPVLIKEQLLSPRQLQGETVYCEVQFKTASECGCHPCAELALKDSAQQLKPFTLLITVCSALG